MTETQSSSERNMEHLYDAIEKSLQPESTGWEVVEQCEIDPFEHTQFPYIAIRNKKRKVVIIFRLDTDSVWIGPIMPDQRIKYSFHHKTYSNAFRPASHIGSLVSRRMRAVFYEAIAQRLDGIKVKARV